MDLLGRPSVAAPELLKRQLHRYRTLGRPRRVRPYRCPSLLDKDPLQFKGPSLVVDVVVDGQCATIGRESPLASGLLSDRSFGSGRGYFVVDNDPSVG